MKTDDDGLTKWLKELGVTDAPVPRQGLGYALDFFHDRMPALPRTMRFAFLKAMDLSKPVERVVLRPPMELAAFRKCNEDPFKLFYTIVGTGLQNAAINPANRIFMRYSLRTAAEVLASRCAPAIDKWTDDRKYFWGQGGAMQYIIPGSHQCLVLTEAGTTKR
jgi:hypothetical protein